MLARLQTRATSKGTPELIKSPIVRMLTFCAIVGLGLLTGRYAFTAPQNIENASEATITALSIIFGVSSAISSVLTAAAFNSSKISHDPHLSETQKKRLERDDDRTLARQTILNVTAFASIVLGIAYLVSFKADPISLVTKSLAGTFSFGATISLLFALYLPILHRAALRRSIYISRKQLQRKSGAE